MSLENCPEPVQRGFEQTCESLNALEGRIGRTTRVAITIALALVIPVASGAILMYAQGARQEVALQSHATVDDTRERAALVVASRQMEVRETAAALMARVTGLESEVAEIKVTVRETNSMVREMQQADRAERRR